MKDIIPAKNTHGRCCGNHLISLPQKERIKHNLYTYEYNLFKELMKGKPKPTRPQKEEAEEKGSLLRCGSSA